MISVGDAILWTLVALAALQAIFSLTLVVGVLRLLPRASKAHIYRLAHEVHIAQAVADRDLAKQDQIALKTALEVEEEMTPEAQAVLAKELAGLDDDTIATILDRAASTGQDALSIYRSMRRNQEQGLPPKL